jgi:hypothetical protein
MAAERKPGSERGRPALDWERAFLHYAALAPEERSYAAVAAEFGVSARTVERHGRRERWRERARELDREASRAAAARLVEERTARLGDLERLVEASLLGYAQKLREGTVRLSAADLPRLHKLLRELWQEPPLEPIEPGPAAPGDEQSASLEHKLQVLRALQEAGLLEQNDEPRARRQDRDHDADHDPEPDRDAARDSDRDDSDRDRERERRPPARGGGSR